MVAKTIVLFRFSAMGDVAMLIPVIEQFLEQYPSYRLCVVSRGVWKGIFEKMDRVEFFPVDFKKEYRGILGLFKLVRVLLKNYPNARFLDLHAVLRTYILCFFALLFGHSYIRLRKPRQERNRAIRRNRKEIGGISTVFEGYANVFRVIESTFKFSSTYKLKTRFFNPEVYNTKQGIWVGIAPFARHRGKILPLFIIEETIQKLIAKYPNITIWLFGGSKTEKMLLDGLVELFPYNLFNITGKKTLQQELEIISCLDVMISMDSANMHLAALCNTRVVSIWGATHPCCGFLGWGQQLEDCVQMDLSCRPCSVYGHKPCFRKDYACLQGISANDIAHKI